MMWSCDGAGRPGARAAPFRTKLRRETSGLGLRFFFPLDVFSLQRWRAITQRHLAIDLKCMLLSYSWFS